MVSKTKLEDLGVKLTEVISSATGKTKGKIDKATRASFQEVCLDIIEATPFDTGVARANWFFTSMKPSSKTTKSTNSSSKGSQIKSKLATGALGKTFYLTNNLPYISVLEFGGYPKNPKKGTWNKSRKRFEIRSINGRSKLAPKGMVRTSLKRFDAIFNKNLKAITK